MKLWMLWLSFPAIGSQYSRAQAKSKHLRGRYRLILETRCTLTLLGGCGSVIVNRYRYSIILAPPMHDKYLYAGLIRLHVLHHAAKEPIYGLAMIEELGRHGYQDQRRNAVPDPA